jgi:hypothetical protein
MRYQCSRALQTGRRRPTTRTPRNRACSAAMRVSAAGLFLLIATAGCGGGVKTVTAPAPAAKPAAKAKPTASAPSDLPPAQAIAVADAQLAIAKYCVTVTGGDQPSGREIDRAIRGTDRLIAIYRRSPDAFYGVGKESMKQVLVDQASSFDNGCDKSAARQLLRVVNYG